MKKIEVFAVGLLALCPTVFVFNEGLGTVIKVYATTLLVLMLSALFCRRKATVLFSVVICFILSLSVVTSLYFSFELNTSFSSSMAATFIHTNQKESIDMLLYNSRYPIGFALIFLFYMMLSYYLSRRVAERKLLIAGGMLMVYGVITIFLYFVSGKTRSEDFILAERVLINTPFYNYAPLVRAYTEAEMTDIVIHANNVFDYTRQANGIDNFVIVIGESARRKDHGLYGSPYPTTPYSDAQRNNMLLFNHAISPAPLTILSVPASLAKVNLAEKVPVAAYADNVVSLANSLSMDTYWFSNQGSIGQSNSLITAMAKRSRHSHWNETIGFDASLVDELQSVIHKPGKKLIVLHFYGSHEPACQRFPANEAINFSEDVNDNCYLNSIAYTDKQLGRVFEILAGSRSSLMYFSDHGLIRDPQKYQNYYHHDISNPVQQAYDIPLFIWYSDKVTQVAKRGVVFQDYYSTSNNYWLISDWLGVTQADTRRCASPLSDCYRAPQNLQVMDGNKNILDYTTLPLEIR